MLKYAVLLLPLCVGSFWLGRYQSAKSTTPVNPKSSLVGDEGIKINPIADQKVAPVKAVNQLKEILSVSADPHRLVRFRLGVRNLNVRQLEELWRYSRTVLDLADEDQRHLASAILSELVQKDPDSALAFAEELGPWKRHGIMAEMIASWSLKDQDSALAWIREADSGLRDLAFVAVMKTLGATDRENALALLRQNIAVGVISASLWNPREFFREWAVQDPHKAMQEAVKLAEIAKNSAVSSVMSAWARTDPASARDWFKANRGQFKTVQVESLEKHLVDGWADYDPRGAANYLLTMDDPKVQESASHYLLRDWTARSFQEAADWVATVEDPERRQLFEYIMVAKNQGDPSASVAFGVENFDKHGGMYHALFLQSQPFLELDPVAGIEWINQNLPEKVRQELYSSVLNKVRRFKPEEVQHHLDVLTIPNRRIRHYAATADDWANQDLEGAQAWANALPDSPERNVALAGVANQWIKQDPHNARVWIDELEASETRDQIAETFVFRTSGDDLEMALGMAESIGNDFRRDRATEQVMTSWLKQDPAAARTAIADHESLSDIAKWRLLGKETP